MCQRKPERGLQFNVAAQVADELRHRFQLEVGTIRQDGAVPSDARLTLSFLFSSLSQHLLLERQCIEVANCRGTNPVWTENASSVRTEFQHSILVEMTCEVLTSHWVLMSSGLRPGLCFHRLEAAG